MIRFVSIPVLFLILSSRARAQSSFGCAVKNKCNECIQEFGCVWCTNSNHTSNCYAEDANVRCGASVVDPMTSSFILLDRPLQLKPDMVQVQMRPQFVKLRLRKGEAYQLKFQYAQAANFPIDLYYLMDFSSSMQPHKRSLGDLGDKLIQTMQEITSNFRIGFGSFVDKRTGPFINEEPSRVQNPCGGNHPCAPAYSFKNHLSLSDGADFVRKVREGKLSGNVDSPEGGFDALVQTMVCNEEIGWRKQARKLIVFSTDATTHIAGDGKLGGVIEPNPGECHMRDHMYTKDVIHDYPSISQIDHVARNLGYNIFFAVTPSSLGIYRNLVNNIKNSAVEKLSEDSNIPALIKAYYKKISNEIRMNDDGNRNGIRIAYSSDCDSQIPDGCSVVHNGAVINFVATVTATSCYPDERNVTIRAGTLAETLTLGVEVTCECDCEFPSHGTHEKSSPFCGGHGNKICGVCDCHEGYYGRNCECDGENDLVHNDAPCQRNGTVCSGEGTCVCGKCRCFNDYYGPYCECERRSCQINNKKLCSGNGECDCGVCSCAADWTGEACQCPVSNSTCVSDGEVCSKHGDCVCGKCTCHSGFYGDFCDECGTCEGRRCEELSPCVECLVHRSGKYKNSCELKCVTQQVTTVETIEVNQNDVDTKEKICTIRTEENCLLTFSYVYGKDAIAIWAERELRCPKPINLLAVISSVVGSVLLAGLIVLLIWKACTAMHDRREYSKFENERANARWNQSDNPLFKKPVSKFRNPAYARRSLIKSTSSATATPTTT